jgi:hypothetical protein
VMPKNCTPVEPRAESYVLLRTGVRAVEHEVQKGFMSSTINMSFLHVMVLCFVLRTRRCPCQSFMLCVLVQGMVLQYQIENPSISLNLFYSFIGHKQKSYEKNGAAPHHHFKVHRLG